MIENKVINTNIKYIGKLAQYYITESLGDNHLYPVYLAQKADSDEVYVIKIINTDDESFHNECKVFELPQHKNIIRAQDILTSLLVETNKCPDTITDNKLICLDRPKNTIVMEFAENGDMFNYLIQGPLSESITRYFFEQILNAVEHLHDNNFCHLDLKLDNILLDSEFNVKLSDFGFASKIEDNKPLYKKVGTLGYRPPEMWKLGADFSGYNGIKADIFQLGVILFIFIAGVPPFAEAHFEDIWYRPALIGRWELFWNFKETNMKTKKQGSKVFDNGFKALVMQLLCPNECLRPAIQGIRESNWYKSSQPASTEEVVAEMKLRKKKMI